MHRPKVVGPKAVAAVEMQPRLPKASPSAQSKTVCPKQAILLWAGPSQAAGARLHEGVWPVCLTGVPSAQLQARLLNWQVCSTADPSAQASPFARLQARLFNCKPVCPDTSRSAHIQTRLDTGPSAQLQTRLLNCRPGYSTAGTSVQCRPTPSGRCDPARLLDAGPSAPCRRARLLRAATAPICSVQARASVPCRRALPFCLKTALLVRVRRFLATICVLGQCILKWRDAPTEWVQIVRGPRPKSAKLPLAARRSGATRPQTAKGGATSAPMLPLMVDVAFKMALRIPQAKKDAVCPQTK